MAHQDVLWAWGLLLIYSSITQAMTSPPTKELANDISIFNKKSTKINSTEVEDSLKPVPPRSSPIRSPQPKIEISNKESAHARPVLPTPSSMSSWYPSLAQRENAFDFSGDDEDVDSEDDFDVEEPEKDIFKSEQFIFANTSAPLVIATKVNGNADYSLLGPFESTPDYQTIQTHQNPINSKDGNVVDAVTFLQGQTATSPNNPPVFDVGTRHTILAHTETVQATARLIVTLGNLSPTSTSTPSATGSYQSPGKQETIVQFEGIPDRGLSPSVTGSSLSKMEQTLVKKGQGESHLTPASLQSASPLITKSGHSPITRESSLIVGQPSAGNRMDLLNVTGPVKTSSQDNRQRTANFAAHALNLPTSSATQQLGPGVEWQVTDQANPSGKSGDTVDSATMTQQHRTLSYGTGRSLSAHQTTHSYPSSEHGYDIYTNPANNMTTVIEVLHGARFLNVPRSVPDGGFTARAVLPTEKITISPTARLQHLTMKGGRRGVTSTEPTKADTSTYFLALTAWRRAPSVETNSILTSARTMKAGHTLSDTFMASLQTKPTVLPQRLSARVSNKTNIIMTQQPLTQEGTGAKRTTTSLSLPWATLKPLSPTSHPTKIFQVEASNETGPVTVRATPRGTGKPAIHNVMTTTMGGQSERMSLPCTPLSPSGRISVTRRCTATPLLLPKLSQAVIPLSVNQCGQRINPLHPPGVKRRTVALETFAAHHHNQQRVLVMRQKEYNRYHQGWQRPFYGSVAEKEEYRREIRQLLKWQMGQQWESQRYALVNRIKEGEAAREAERQANLLDLEKQSARSRFLQEIRDENKKLMETQWKEKRLAKSLDSLRERELLQYNPINWSCTLK
ncbi:flocculation protein FLO11 isoform X2 [Scyliorhinus canicula]|uniref:flocculation protein FLO11 isoform X2 n=1 Tax=Scyliorhinus canicula TaxID=7830 RepID=UPI0018F6AD12|nr:flocculation protein FLO11 isoform X2 [Scyliorhinus canicula]